MPTKAELEDEISALEEELEILKSQTVQEYSFPDPDFQRIHEQMVEIASKRDLLMLASQRHLTEVLERFLRVLRSIERPKE